MRKPGAAFGRPFSLWQTPPMTDASRLDQLRAEYRKQWDLHQFIANQNARQVQAGTQPSNEQLINEQRAAEAAALARDELKAAMSRLKP